MGNTLKAVSMLLTAATVISGWSCKPIPSVPSAAANTTSGNQFVVPPPVQTTNQTRSNPSANSTIKVNVSPPGSGTVSRSTGNDSNGTDVTFTATPASGYVFSSWWHEYSDAGVTRGGKIGDNLTLKLDFELSGSLTVYFVALPVAQKPTVANASPAVTLPPSMVKYNLTVLVDPPGAGSVSPGNGTYEAGSAVIVNATPAGGYQLKEWSVYNNVGTSGGYRGASFTISMSSDTAVLVSFTSSTNPEPVTSGPQLSRTSQTSYPLVVLVDPPWAGSVSPTTGMYDAGTNLSLTATPASGYVVSWWNVAEGEYAGSGNTISTIINKITIVSVHFVASPSIWNGACLYHTGQRISPGEYFYVSADYTGGQFGPDSVRATYDTSLVALIDRRDAGGVGPITPGMHFASVWLLFKALKPGTAVISAAQVRNGYSGPATKYTVTIGN